MVAPLWLAASWSKPVTRRTAEYDVAYDILTVGVGSTTVTTYFSVGSSEDTMRSVPVGSLARQR